MPGIKFNQNQTKYNKYRYIYTKTKAMIIPENQIPTDDSENSDKDDQMSQQDIHSNGFDDNAELTAEEESEADANRLRQADKASEAAYTLNLGAEAPKKKE